MLAGDLFSLSTRTDFQNKLDLLKDLFSIDTGEQKLEVQYADGSFRYVMAEVRNTMGLQWQTFPTRSTAYSIELVASDPFWYGSALEATQSRTAWYFDSGIAFDDGTHWFDTTTQSFKQRVTFSPINIEATNSGDVYTRKPAFTFEGYVVNPTLTNLRNGYSLQIIKTTAALDTMVIDCGAQQVTINGQAQPLSAVVPGNGQVDWMRLEAGENTLVVNLGVAAPWVLYSAQYSPAYL